MSGLVDLMSEMTLFVSAITVLKIPRTWRCSGLVHDAQAFNKTFSKCGIANSRTKAMFPTLNESTDMDPVSDGRIPVSPKMRLSFTC